MSKAVLHLFEGFGIELEYMIVDSITGKVKPISDQLLKYFAGEIIGDIDFEETSWSNELALHVIELKTNGPASSLKDLGRIFQQDILKINQALKPFSAELCPTAMHPTMDPFSETNLWPHDYNIVYEKYNEIFDCRGHGWSNLQSVHINLPFGNEEEFGKLHAAIRFLLPLLPGLTASSPIMDGKLTGLKDTRLEVYRHNSSKIPSISGQIIPEPAYTFSDYDRMIFQPMYQDISPYDPYKILQYEFLNSRGAIARFDRDAIEIRVLDIQECPMMDLALASLIISVIDSFVNDRFYPIDSIKNFPTQELADIFLSVIHEAEETQITNETYLRCFNLMDTSVSVKNMWFKLFSAVRYQSRYITPEYESLLETWFTLGSLSTRIQQKFEKDQTEKNLQLIYQQLRDCLNNGKIFI